MRKTQMSARLSALINNLFGGLTLVNEEFKAAVECIKKFTGIENTCKILLVTSLICTDEGVNVLSTAKTEITSSQQREVI